MELQLASYCLQSGQLLTTAGAAVCLQGSNVVHLLSRSSYHTRSSSSSTESASVSTCYQSSDLLASRGPLTGPQLRAGFLPLGHHPFSTRTASDSIDNNDMTNDNLRALKRARSRSKPVMAYTLTQAMEQSYCPSVIHLPAIPAPTPILMDEGDMYDEPAAKAPAATMLAHSAPGSPSRTMPMASRPPSPAANFGMQRFLATVTGTSKAAATSVPAPLHPESPADLVEFFAHGKGQPRLKGISRKLLLRQVNRRIISRLARRATIAIPVLGFYFVSKLLVKDYARVRSEAAAGNNVVAGLFATAFAMDLLDLAAQATIISGIAHGNFGMGVGVAAAMLVAADKASLATAAISCLSGISGELISAAHEEHAVEQVAAEAVSTDPAAPETETAEKQ